MTRVLLFCTDEAAKPVAREVLNFKYGEEPNTSGQYFLVESNVLPADRWGFKTELKDDEDFESDFIGASPQECQAWALEKHEQVNFIEMYIIAIVDARSAQDKTILMSLYIFPELCEPPLMQFPPFGTLPRPQLARTWIDYRIEYRDAFTLKVFWAYGDPGIFYPGYFGKKEDFTDDRGVFNVAKAQEFCMTYNPNDYYAGPLRL